MKCTKTNETSNREMITISRAEYEAMQAQLDAKTAELAHALLQNRWLMEQLKLNKRKLFGSSSEQLDQMVMDKFAYLFNEAEAWDADSVEPARFWVREDRYPTHACKHCEKETGEAVVVPTPMEPAVIPGSFASSSVIAHLAMQKYVMYSPLYRLEQEFDRQGLKLSRQTMSNWLLKATENWLQPIYDVLHQPLCREAVLHGDETTLQVLHEKGKSATSKSYMWLYRTSGHAENPIVLYDYQPNRKAEVPGGILRLAPCGRLPGLPQAAGTDPCGGLLGPCQTQI